MGSSQKPSQEGRQKACSQETSSQESRQEVNCRRNLPSLQLQQTNWSFSGPPKSSRKILAFSMIETILLLLFSFSTLLPLTLLHIFASFPSPLICFFLPTKSIHILQLVI